MILYLPPKHLAKTTVEVSTDTLKQNGIEVVNRWFHSPHGVDLFVWYGSAKSIMKVQLSVLGAILDWSISGGLRTGIVTEEDAVERISFDAVVVKSTLDYGTFVLKLMSCLNPQEKSEILGLFRPTLNSAPVDLSEPSPWWRRIFKGIRSGF